MGVWQNIKCFLGFHDAYYLREKYGPMPTGLFTAGDPPGWDWNNCISDYAMYCHNCDLHMIYSNPDEDWVDLTQRERREREKAQEFEEIKRVVKNKEDL